MFPYLLKGLVSAISQRLAFDSKSTDNASYFYFAGGQQFECSLLPMKFFKRAHKSRIG